MLPNTITPQLLSQLELLRLSTRRAFLGSRQGGHLSLVRGHGIEFSDYRKYELGDNPRHIDWSVFARSDRLYIKRFQEEQDVSLILMLDTSASMRTASGDGKWERARDLALALAYVALMEQDTVVIATSAGRVSPHYHGARAIHQVSRYLNDIPDDPGDGFAQGLRRALAAVRFPGVAVLLSDFLFEESIAEAIVRMILAKNFDASLIQILSASDVDPFDPPGPCIAVDSETEEEVELAGDEASRAQYSFLLSQHTAKLQRLSHHHRMRFLRFLPTIPLDEFLLRHLPESGLLR